MTDQLDATAVDAAAELGRRLADAGKSRLISVNQEGHAPFVIPLRHDEDLREFDPEKYLDWPHRARGDAGMHDPASFAAYVTRLAPDKKATSLWADDQKRTITAVFNDHSSADSPGWRDHTATLTVRVDVDWAAWIGNNGKLIPQVLFGEFLENQLHAIYDPPAADLVSIAKTLVGKRNLSFESSVKWESSDVVFDYREQTQAKVGTGKVEIPKSFTIRIAPFVGVAPVEMVARLRFDISREALSLGYQLTRPDRAEKEAFDRIVTQVVEGTPEGVPMLLGTAPAALR